MPGLVAIRLPQTPLRGRDTDLCRGQILRENSRGGIHPEDIHLRTEYFRGIGAGQALPDARFRATMGESGG